MHEPSVAYGDTRLLFWSRVRRFAVPQAMIETATARRRAGDWAGACAAARVDTDLDPRAAARTYGSELARRLRADLRQLAPDLLRWHMPRIAPDGLLRPGLTVPLARYGDSGPVYLVARTPPAWADAGQRISLALWDGSAGAHGAPHPHPRPSRRFRLDLHRHLWDAGRAGELRQRSGADGPPGGCPEPWPPGLRSLAVPDTAAGRPGPLQRADSGAYRELVVAAPTSASSTAWTAAGGDPYAVPADPAVGPAGWSELVPPGLGCAVDRWAAEAALLRRAEGPAEGPVAVRIGARQRLVLTPGVDGGPPALRKAGADGAGRTRGLPVLPDAATWVPPDLELLSAGLLLANDLHPLVAAALVPGYAPPEPGAPLERAALPRLVECRGTRHRIGLVDGALAPLDHDPDEIRREELLAALTGTPLPCLQVIDAVHRAPECLDDVRARLDHGDIAGALAVVEGLLGPEALLRDGALRDALEEAAERRLAYVLFRAGLGGPGPRRTRPKDPPTRSRPSRFALGRSRKRHAMAR